MRYVAAASLASTRRARRSPRDRRRSRSAGEVLIEVSHAGVSRPDCAQRAGTYPPPPGASPIIGLEVARHHSVPAAPASQSWRDGRRRARIDAGRRLRGVLHDVRGLLPADSFRAHRARSREPAGKLLHRLEQRHRSRPSCSAARNSSSTAAPSGIGLAAIQLAEAVRRDGAHDGGQRRTRRAFCRSLGADHAINYRTQDFVAEVARITGKAGVDVDPRHGRRRLHRKNLECHGARGPPRDDRLSARQAASKSTGGAS